MALQKTVEQQWFSTTGVRIVEGYGLSETSPVLTVNPVTTKVFRASIGLPVPDTLVAILDESGQPKRLMR